MQALASRIQHLVLKKRDRQIQVGSGRIALHLDTSAAGWSLWDGSSNVELPGTMFHSHSPNPHGTQTKWEF